MKWHIRLHLVKRLTATWNLFVKNKIILTSLTPNPWCLLTPWKITIIMLPNSNWWWCKTWFSKMALPLKHCTVTQVWFAVLVTSLQCTSVIRESKQLNVQFFQKKCTIVTQTTMSNLELEPTIGGGGRMGQKDSPTLTPSLFFTVTHPFSTNLFLSPVFCFQ